MTALFTKAASSKGWLLVLLLVLAGFSAAPSSAATLEEIHRLIDGGRYRDALPLLQDYSLRIDCDDTCLGEVLLLSGYCRFELNLTDRALEDLSESIRFRPRHRVSEADYPPGFVELFERARSKVLCSVEIRVITPRTLALRTGYQISTVFKATEVPATSIELKSSRYGRAQRYYLLPGQLNTFDLELEELRDYHAFDSLHLSLKPVVNESARGSWTSDAPEEVSSCVDIGAYCVELMPSNYSPGELSQIVIEGERSALRISVLLARPEWSKLHKNLASNPNRQTLVKVVKITSIAGSVITAVWAMRANSEADKKYDSYMTKIDPTEISDTYRAYTDFIDKRNLLGVFSICFAATGVLSQLLSPRNERELIEDYERNYRESGLSLEVRGDYVGLRASLNL